MPVNRAEVDFTPIRFDGQRLHLLDQRRLPAHEKWLAIATSAQAASAIRALVVRGAPAIGIAAAYACVLAARHRGAARSAWDEDLRQLEQARPTAVNLGWAIARMRRCADRGAGLDPNRLLAEARAIHRADIAANRRMAGIGAGLLGRGASVLTHCNTGALATGGVGTALGVIVEGWRQGRIRRIWVDETRPWLQGARLTAWELARLGIPFRVVVEGAAASLMAGGAVDQVITGADRIAANGDVANKIGTCMLAVLAHHYGADMMVVAPSSTLDLQLSSGAEIAIEERAGAEIWQAAGIDPVPPGFDAFNPVFDITPGALIDCIVTEHGAHYPPFGFGPAAAGESP